MFFFFDKKSFKNSIFDKKLSFLIKFKILWRQKIKQILKSELIKRGVSHQELANRLSNIGVKETKASVDNKISRGTFSAAFLLQSLEVIGCQHLYLPKEEKFSIAAEPEIEYQINEDV